MIFASWIVRWRVAVVVGWIALTVTSFLYLDPSVAGAGGGLEGLIPQNSRALQAEIDSFELFGFPLLSRTLVVQRDPEKMSPRAQARVFLRALALNRHLYPDLDRIAGALPITNTLGLFPSSHERGTTAITYLFFLPEVGLGTRERLASRFGDDRVNRPGDALVGITGAVPGRIQEGRLIKGSLPQVELATVVLIALIVGLHFRSPGPPLVALAAAGISYILAIRVVGRLAQSFGLSLPEELEPLIVVLLLGIVTDYSIFFLSGTQAALKNGRSSHAAAAHAGGSIMKIIVVAGLTVAAGTSALVVATLDAFKALGPGLGVTVLVGLLVSITFIPACLALLGARLFWPRDLQRTPTGRKPERVHAHLRRLGGLPRSLTVAIARRRMVALEAAAACLALLLTLSAFTTNTALGFGIVGGLPEESEPAQAAEAAARGFVPGILSPSVLVLKGSGAGRDPQRLSVLQELIERQPGVAATVGPRELGLLARALENVRATDRSLRGGRNAASLLLRGAISRTRDAARLVVILSDPPLGARAIATLRGLSSRLPELLQAAGLAVSSAAFAGDTALAAETIQQTVDDLRRIAFVVLVVDLLLLAIFLRALVAPLYLMGASLLGFLASLGLSTLVFQVVFEQGSFSFFVPFASAVLLVSLGSDYNIFLVGRVWEERRRTSLRTAVARAAPRASGAIAVAGITLAASFAMLVLIPLDAFRQFAVTMSTGILIDTFVVRAFLVPALMSLVGERSSWPGRLKTAEASIET